MGASLKKIRVRCIVKVDAVLDGKERTMNDRSHSAAVLAVLQQKYVLVVREYARLPPRFWKFPAGRKERDEGTQETGARTLWEETGIRVYPEALEEIYREERSDHDFVLLLAMLDNDPRDVPKYGNKGQDIDVVPLTEWRSFLDRDDILRRHARIARSRQVRQALARCTAHSDRFAT